MTLLRHVLAALLKACVRHALAEATVIQGVSLQAPHLLIEQIVCLMDETDRDVRDDLGWTCFRKLLVLSVGHIWVGAEPPNELRFPAVLSP